MKIGKVFLRTGVVLLSAFCLLVFQVVTKSILAKTRVYAKGQFETLAPNTVTITPAVEGGTPAPTPISTLEPEDYFDEDDESRPEYQEIEDGDRWFGYAEVRDDPDSYLMWFTDEDGTHYRLVSSDSKVLFGTIDPSTGERRENGYDQLIADRDTLIKDLDDLRLEISGEANSRDGSFLAAGIVIGGGLIVCIFLTAGLCTIAAPIAAPAGLAFAGVGVNNGIDHSNLLDKKDALVEDIDEQEGRITDRFDRPEN